METFLTAPHTVQSTRVAATVERMGVFFERAGWTPLHGRVFAYLMIADPGQQDFVAIQEFLMASKSAISTAIKFLMDTKLVTYTTLPGDRKRYFMIDQPGWYRVIEERTRSAARFTELLELAVATRGERDDDLNDFLLKVQNFYGELDEALADFLARRREC